MAKNEITLGEGGSTIPALKEIHTIFITLVARQLELGAIPGRSVRRQGF
jgi:hypothetical protein